MAIRSFIVSQVSGVKVYLILVSVLICAALSLCLDRLIYVSTLT